MNVDFEQLRRYRETFPEDADRMSIAWISAENHGLTEEFSELLKTALDRDLRANWTMLLAAGGGIFRT